MLEPSTFLPFLRDTLKGNPSNEPSGDLRDSVVLPGETLISRLFPLPSHEVNDRCKREGGIAASRKYD